MHEKTYERWNRKTVDFSLLTSEEMTIDHELQSCHLEFRVNNPYDCMKITPSSL